mmetsp:Transcript_5710/g.10464  ORF Transcript_5710/g.10464 Transcript_5710/m.10464 type:complete len:247 (+) Transcript_5710:406-1146(+)
MQITLPHRKRAGGPALKGGGPRGSAATACKPGGPRLGKAVGDPKAAVTKPLHPQLALEEYGWRVTDSYCWGGRGTKGRVWTHCSSRACLRTTFTAISVHDCVSQYCRKSAEVDHRPPSGDRQQSPAVSRYCAVSAPQGPWPWEHSGSSVDAGDVSCLASSLASSLASAGGAGGGAPLRVAATSAGSSGGGAPLTAAARAGQRWVRQGSTTTSRPTPSSAQPVLKKRSAPSSSRRWSIILAPLQNLE